MAERVGRGAKAVAGQPTIRLIVKRSEFRELIQREPNLGLTVMKNLAYEMADRLRKTNEAIQASYR
ncbi:MAG: hypothetical protein ACKVHO_10145 [Verrucomicrobiia bacterium]|jgi:CRP-like cAMP-binding protein